MMKTETKQQIRMSDDQIRSIEELFQADLLSLLNNECDGCKYPVSGDVSLLQKEEFPGIIYYKALIGFLIYRNFIY